MKMKIEGSLEQELFRLASAYGISPSRMATNLIKQSIKHHSTANSQQEKQTNGTTKY